MALVLIHGCGTIPWKEAEAQQGCSLPRLHPIMTLTLCEGIPPPAPAPTLGTCAELELGPRHLHPHLQKAAEP